MLVLSVRGDFGPFSALCVVKSSRLTGEPKSALYVVWFVCFLFVVVVLKIVHPVMELVPRQGSPKSV